MQKKKRNQVNAIFWFTGFQVVEFKLMSKTKNSAVTYVMDQLQVLFPREIKGHISVVGRK